jgi:hypothetical protein
MEHDGGSSRNSALDSLCPIAVRCRPDPPRSSGDMLGHRLVMDESLMTINVRVSPSVVSPLVFLVVLRSALPSSCNCAAATFSPLGQAIAFHAYGSA